MSRSRAVVVLVTLAPVLAEVAGSERNRAAEESLASSAALDSAARSVGAAPVEPEEVRVPPSEGIPIHVAGREVYRMRVSLGPFSPEERARAAGERIRMILGAPRFVPNEIRARERDGRFLITHGDEVIFSVLPQDFPDGVEPTGVVAERVARELSAAIELDRESRTPERLAFATALALLVLAAVVALAWGAIVLSRRAGATMVGWKARFSAGSTSADSS